MKFSPIASAALAGLLAFGSANAAEYDLGAATIGTPLSFGGLTAVGPFNDIFTFSMPDNGGSGYSVSNFMLLPGLYNTVLATMSLVSNPDGILYNGDDMLVGSSSVPGGDIINLKVGPTMGGMYYLNVTGIGNGDAGGIYTGAISVTAVPEPETYAMMLAGLGAIGFMAARRRRQG